MSWLHSCRLPGPLTVLMLNRHDGDQWRCWKCKRVWTLSDYAGGWQWSA